jgi:LTXXQ motif family protein
VRHPVVPQTRRLLRFLLLRVDFRARPFSRELVSAITRPPFDPGKAESVKPRTLFLVGAACLLTTPVIAADMPYAGQQARAIKALSEEEVAALRKGEGMGMAKAAELNGYPGPAHVLQLAAQLRLTDAQRREVEAIFDRMSAAAKTLGAALIVQEQALDQLFAKGDITPDRLAAATAAIAGLQGRLRAVHLSAHLETRALLNPDQIIRYEQLRGYDDAPALVQHYHHG